MSAAPVTLTEGVTSTLAAFGMMHTAFLSAVPSANPVKATTDPVSNNKRALKEFIDSYSRANSLATQLHEPNNAYKEAASKFKKNAGNLLVSFAERWRTYVTTKQNLPTKSTKQAVNKDLTELEGIDVRGETGKISMLAKASDMVKQTYYYQYRTVKDILNHLIKKRKDVHPNGNRLGMGYQEDKKASIDLLDSEIKSILQDARTNWEGIQIMPLDTTTATWVDFLDQSSELGISGTDFQPEKDAAENLLKSLDMFYANSGLVLPLIAFLTSASLIADKLQEDLNRVQPVIPDNTALIDHMKKYSVTLRNLISELESASTVISNRPLPWSSQFTNLKDLSIAASRISSIWGVRATTMSIGWVRPALQSYTSSPGVGTGYSGAASSSGTAFGLGSGSSGSGGKGSSHGPLVRIIDLDRVKECTLLASKFSDSIDPTTDSNTAERLWTNAQTALSAIGNKISPLVQTNPNDNVSAVDDLRKQQVLAIQSFLHRLRALMTRHLNRHASFALRHNRGPLRYMLYWRDCEVPMMKQHTTEYFDKLKDAALKGTKEITKIAAVLDILLKDKIVMGGGLTDSDLEGIMDKSESLREYRESCKDRINAVHSRPSTFLDQLVTDSHVHIIYILKLVRFALAWMATSIATKAFTSVYASNVYIKNIDPPPPAVYLGMFFGVNLALNVGLLTIMWAANRVFKSPSNEFPIDTYLLTAWVVDAACSELAMVAIAFAFASIIATKKAFRYRQEGDRGIRALGQMMLYSYAVLLCVPFFRIV